MSSEPSSSYTNGLSSRATLPLTGDEYGALFKQDEPKGVEKGNRVALWASAGEELTRLQIEQEFEEIKPAWVFGVSPGIHKYFSSSEMELYLQTISRTPELNATNGKIVVFGAIYAENFWKLFPAFDEPEARKRVEQFDSLKNPDSPYQYIPAPLTGDRKTTTWQEVYVNKLQEHSNNWQIAYAQTRKEAAYTHANWLAREKTLSHTQVEAITQRIFPNNKLITFINAEDFDDPHLLLGKLLKVVDDLSQHDSSIASKAAVEGREHLKFDSIHLANSRAYKGTSKSNEYADELEIGAVNYAKKEIAIVLAYIFWMASDEPAQHIQWVDLLTQKLASYQPSADASDLKAFFRRVLFETFDSDAKRICAIYPKLFSSDNPLGYFVDQYISPQLLQYRHFELVTKSDLLKRAKAERLKPKTEKREYGAGSSKLDLVKTDHIPYNGPSSGDSMKVARPVPVPTSEHALRQPSGQAASVTDNVFDYLPPDIARQIPPGLRSDPKEGLAFVHLLRAQQRRDNELEIAEFLMSAAVRRTSPGTSPEGSLNGGSPPPSSGGSPKSSPSSSPSSSPKDDSPVGTAAARGDKKAPRLRSATADQHQAAPAPQLSLVPAAQQSAPPAPTKSRSPSPDNSGASE
jgi:hypothetical protein